MIDCTRSEVTLIKEGLVCVHVLCVMCVMNFLIHIPTVCVCVCVEPVARLDRRGRVSGWNRTDGGGPGGSTISYQ